MTKSVRDGKLFADLEVPGQFWRFDGAIVGVRVGVLDRVPSQMRPNSEKKRRGHVTRNEYHA